MKWPWQKDEDEGDHVPIKDPDLDDARRRKEDLLVRAIALGIEADTIVRR